MAVSKRTRFEVLRRDNYTCHLGLPVNVMTDAASVAGMARGVYDRPAYFAGICWKRLRAMQEIAQQIVDGEG